MRHYKVLNHILNVIILVITCYYTPNYNFLLKMITIDSLFSAIYFLRIYINRNITENEIVDQSSELYNSSLADRYIYYFLQYGFYNLLKMVFWIPKLEVIYYFMIGMLLPPILNLIMKSKLFDMIRIKKEKIVKTIVAKQFAGGITFISRAFLNKDIKLKHKEFIPLLENYKDTTTYLLEGLKNTLIVLLVFYMKTCSPGLYYRMTKYFVGYKTGDVLHSFNDESARRVVSSVIDGRKWEEFLKPNIYYALFYLYWTNNEKTSFIKELILRINRQMTKMFCIWTFSSFMNEILIAPGLSLFMIAYRSHLKFYKDRETMLKSLTLLLGGLIGYFSESFFLMSFLCQFAYMLLINNISFSIIRFIFKKIRKSFWKVNMINGKYIIPLSYVTATTLVFGNIINIYNFPLFLMGVGYATLVNYDYKKFFMISYLLCIGYFSLYNPFHIILNAMLIYYLTSFMDIAEILYYINNCKKEIKLEKIKDFLLKDSCIYKHSNIDKRKSEIVAENIENNLEDSISEQVFDLPRDQFIEAISVNSNIDEIIDNSFYKIEMEKDDRLFDVTELPSVTLVENYYEKLEKVE